MKDAVIRLRKQIGFERPFRNQRAMAKHFGYHESYVSLVLNGLRPTPPEMLEFLRGGRSNGQARSRDSR